MDALSTYLSDQLGSLRDAAAAFEPERAGARDTPIGELLGRLAERFRDDEQILTGILRQRGFRESIEKTVAGRFLEQLRAGKLSHGTPLERMAALDSLALGVHRRVLLWSALEEVARHHRELQAIDFGFLRARAAECERDLERFRLEAACQVFAADLERSEESPSSPKE